MTTLEMAETASELTALAEDATTPHSAAIRTAEPEPRPDGALSASSYADLPLDERLRRIEAEIIGAVLVETGGNKSKAALRLGIKRSTLGDRIQRCGLEPAQA